ncbi:MAG: GNAT family N-acetyltransferase [Crocinitomicaceae bacterium]|nr:GNAT family N-acetyltransferase [Flavobacteriales bacterium]NQZ36898.1 GNAT family N-acetyltransferase [Crocinitomicaceae bacterium]
MIDPDNTTVKVGTDRKIVESVKDIPQDDWNKVADNRNIYLSLGYLSALESALNDKMQFRYAISYSDTGEPVLIAVYQLVVFVDKRRQYSGVLCNLSYHIHKKIADVFTINVLVCGNVFCDGENGFLSRVITDDEAMDEVAAITESLKKEPSIKGKSSITLFKEFWPDSTSYSDRLKNLQYRDFMVDVNMVLNYHESWCTMDDYLASMKTKFRTRAKSVFSKSKVLSIKDFTIEDIEENSERIELLFGNVLEKSDFSFGQLNAQAFVNFKRNLKDDFSFRGAWLNDELVGFSTALFNGTVIEANFVGLDYEFNKEYSVYQCFLYDYVEQGLNRKMKELHLGRTAELVKSQIGALPTNMKLYAKHRKSVSNLLLRPIIQSISPSEFELRIPFKENFK